MRSFNVGELLVCERPVDGFSWSPPGRALQADALRELVVVQDVVLQGSFPELLPDGPTASLVANSDQPTGRWWPARPARRREAAPAAPWKNTFLSVKKLEKTTFSLPADATVRTVQPRSTQDSASRTGLPERADGDSSPGQADSDAAVLGDFPRTEQASTEDVRADVVSVGECGVELASAALRVSVRVVDPGPELGNTGSSWL